MGQFYLSLCVDLARTCLITSPTRNVKVHQQDELAVCTSSQGGNERIDVTDVHFPNLNPSFYDNFGLKIKVITGFLITG